MQRKIKSYTKSGIVDWAKDLENLPKNIADILQEIAEEEAKLAKLNADLRMHVEGNVNRTAMDIEALQARKYVIQLPAEIDALAKSHAARQQELERLRPLHAIQTDFIKPINARLNKLQKAIEVLECQDEIKRHNDDIAICERIVGESDTNIARRQAELRSIAAQNATADATLFGLQTRRAALQIQLVAVIKRDDDNYAKNQYSSSVSDQGGGFSSSAQTNSQYSSSQSQSSTSQYSSSGGSAMHVSDEQRQLREQLASVEGEIRNIAHILQVGREKEQGLDSECIRLTESRDAELKRKKNLQREIRSDQQRITNAYKMIGSQNWEMNYPSLRNLIAQTESERAPYVAEQARLARELEVNTSERDNLSNRWRSQSELLRSSQKLQGKYSDNNKIAELDSMKIKQQAALALHYAESNLQEALIRKQRDAIKGKKELQNEFEGFLADQQGKKLLFDLRDSAPVLLHTMSVKLRNVIGSYEKTHRSGQSVAVRASLARLQDKIDFILSNNNILLNELKNARRQYEQLSGLIHHEISRLDDDSLVAVLERVIGDECLDFDETVNEYRILQNEYPAVLRDFNADDVKNEDLRLYAKARDDFHAILRQLPANASRQWRNLNKRCQQSLSCMEEHAVAAEKAGDDSFDYKFQTNLIHSLGRIYESPKDAVVREDLRGLSALIPYGNPSFGKKLGGIILMVLGAASVITGLAVGFASVGLLSPITIACAAGGAALFAVGAGLAINGRQKDEAKAVANVQKSASDPKLSSALFPRVDHLAAPRAANEHQEASAPPADQFEIKLN